MRIYIILFLSTLCVNLRAQKAIRDKHITNQQERMVFKQWDRSKFTPSSGFLGLNPDYWITWFLHPNYPDRDLRPLGPVGPQTQRLALTAAMQSTSDAYKLHSDTLGNTAINEAVNYSGLASWTDPLWQLYYRQEFYSLLNGQEWQSLNGIPLNEQEYLLRTGVYQWYTEETAALRERLDAAINTTLDRGSRILAYHGLMLEYRKLTASWEAKRQYARKFLSLSSTARDIKERHGSPLKTSGYRTDVQIADDILSKSKL